MAFKLHSEKLEERIPREDPPDLPILVLHLPPQPLILDRTLACIPFVRKVVKAACDHFAKRMVFSGKIFSIIKYVKVLFTAFYFTVAFNFLSKRISVSGWKEVSVSGWKEVIWKNFSGYI